MFFEMRDASNPERLPEVETSVIYNDVTDAIEIFLDEPINTPDSDVISPRLVMTLPEAWTLWHQLSSALGPDKEKA
jgi:hypothetical protein